MTTSAGRSSSRGAPFRGPGVRRALCAALILAAVCPAALAETPEEAKQRLDNRYYFVKALQDIGDGWDRLLDDFAGTYAAAKGDLPGIDDLRDDARWDRVQILDEGGEALEDRARKLYVEIRSDTKNEKLRTKATKRAGAIYLKQGERAEKGGDDVSALAAFDEAFKFLPDDLPDDKSRAAGRIAGLRSKAGRSLQDAQQYEEALQSYRKVVADPELKQWIGNTPEAQQIRQQLSWIESNTAPLSVLWLGEKRVLERVSGPKADYTRAKLSFTPRTGGQRPPEFDLSNQVPLRLRHGEYSVRATTPTGESTERPLRVGGGGAQLTLTTMLPKDMVVVDGKSGGNSFLIDKYEVSNAQFAAHDATHRSLPAREPARGMKFRVAKDYAARVGKRLPTLAEWLQAAFESKPVAQQPFPWKGTTATINVHAVFKASGPKPVDVCAAGESRFGARNMLGNVMEWVLHRGHGWVVGGSFSTPRWIQNVATGPGASVKSLAFDFRRDPIPGAGALSALSNDEKLQYENINLAKRADVINRVGLRCVVTLGKPRRQP